MQSQSGDASPKVKVEDDSGTKDVSVKVKGEESSPAGASPKVKEENKLYTGKPSPNVKEEVDEFVGSSSPSYLENTEEKTSIVTSSEEEDDEVQVIEHPDIYASNQLVVYDPEANGMGQVEPGPEVADCPPPSLPNYAPNAHSRVLPSVGTFTVQCANCFKWRLIPTKEKYEEIRESILQLPFVCERAREWRPSISCDDPADISQDGSRLWAIDKPNIAQPPPGWERLLRIRGEGSTRFADVYYAAPSGKRLRSMVEIQKYLLEHPEYIRAGVNMSQFSFQIPKPLQENYVRKRPARATSSHETELPMPGSLEPAEVSPLSWVGPDMQSDGPGQSTPPYFETPILRHCSPAKKKRATTSPAKQRYNNSNPVYNESRMKVEEFAQPRNNTASDL